MGVVSPNGIGAEAVERAIFAGESGLSWVREIDGFNGEGLETTGVGRVRGFDGRSEMEAAEVRRVPRMFPLALAASREALAMAGAEWAQDDLEGRRRVGVALGTGG